jgi:3',5'-cyclic AMP phosphodiesterase CpdA
VHTLYVNKYALFPEMVINIQHVLYLVILACTFLGTTGKPLLFGKEVLKFNKDGVFSIVQIADVHLGEGESSWGARVDNHTYQDLKKVLELEAPLSLAVLSGDMLTGLNIDKNATSYWDLLVSVLDEQRLPHTAILGNHDAEPFSGTKQNQSSPGAKTNRSELMEHDATLPLSFSKIGPAHLLPAVSIYVVDVFSNDGREPLLQLYHLDSGGGGMIEEVFIDQISWFKETIKTQRRKFNEKVPALVFVHIPMAEFQNALDEKKSCFGDSDDGVTPTVKNNGLFNVLDATEEVLAVFVGHDHCNDFCCQFGKRSIDLCFGRHSGYGGYQCKNYEQGVRIITIQTNYDARKFSVSTHVRLNNATIIHKGYLV